MYDMQEENKILEKTNRQKVLQVEKLSQTIEELEEAILAGGAAANTIRDYSRQISELNVNMTLKVIDFSFRSNICTEYQLIDSKCVGREKDLGKGISKS